MRALLALAATLSGSGCWYSLDKQATPDASMGSGGCMMGTSSTCMAVQPTLTSIQTNILNANLCSAGACHDGNASTLQGKVDLRDCSMITPACTGATNSYNHLVGFDSLVYSGHKLVVAGQPNQSILLVMLGKIQPSDAGVGPIPGSIGLMPQNGGGVLCCQKLDAVEQWIMNGAMNN